MSLPDWLEPLPDAAQQRALDSWAIEQQGIPGERLMESAGRGLARVVTDLSPQGRVVVVCGKGNNGGDGLVAARRLRDTSPAREVDVLLLGEPDQLRGDAAANLKRLPGPGPERFSPERLEGAAAIVDAVLGTGFSGEPREPAAGAIRAINAGGRAGAAVIACDVPSGVDASTGEVASEAVRASATATFHAGKPGLWIAPGKACAGTVCVIDIGIPASLYSDEARIGLISESVLTEIPRRGSESTKFSAGSVLVCGGSPGLTGAPAMAAIAAARAGAGYVTVAVPASVFSVLASKLLEVMQVELPEADGALAPAAVDAALERAQRVQCVVLGPGLGRAPGALDFAREVALRVEVPLVLDADGLNAHAERLGDLAGRPAPTVLTPHAGELGRLLGIDSSEVAAGRLRRARQAAEAANAVVILKGDDTIVAEPSGRVGISRGGSPALATAGTGDVLSGVLAAHLAKGMEPFTASCAAVQVHASAGRRAAAEIGPEGVIASDVIERLPGVLASRDG